MFTLHVAIGNPSAPVVRSPAIRPPVLRRLASILGSLRRHFVNAQRRRLAIVGLKGMSRQGLRDIDLDRTAVLCGPRRPQKSGTERGPREASDTDIASWARHARASNGFGDAVVALADEPTAPPQ